jgi:glycerol uptake facilitator-like aquaporin
MNTTRRLVAEGIGSVILAAAVVGSGVMAERLADRIKARSIQRGGLMRVRR